MGFLEDFGKVFVKGLAITAEATAKELHDFADNPQQYIKEGVQVIKIIANPEPYISMVKETAKDEPKTHAADPVADSGEKAPLHEFTTYEGDNC